MDLNFSFSPSPSKRTRQTAGLDSIVSNSPLKIATAERIKNTARDLLSGALQEAIRKEDDDDPHSEVESLASLTSPVKRSAGPGVSPLPSPAKARKRKRKCADPGSAFHHTFVMKLFDRSVDLAQFGGSTHYPLYPVCRAWMKNEPSNTSQAPRTRTPTPEPHSDEGEDEEVYRLPEPTPHPQGPSPRLPPPPAVATGRELDLDLDQTDAPPPALLLSNHLVRWWGVRKAWKQAAAENERRYSASLTVIKDMFEK